MLRIANPACIGLFACHTAGAAINLGVLDDFENGTLAGWSPPRGNTSNVPGGPPHSTRALRIDAASRLAAFDAGPDITGAVAPDVDAIRVDMARDAGAGDLEIRLVLFGPGTVNRWTSSVAQTLPGDGEWKSYLFSILEDDLTQVAGGATYADMIGNVNRIMFRHDTGAPSAQGTAVGFPADPFYIDNVKAVPVPAALWLFAGAITALRCGARRHRTPATSD